MGRSELKVRRSDDGGQVEVVLEAGGKPLGAARLDGPAAERHVQEVAEQRAALPDEVPQALEPGTPLSGVFDPRWHVQDADDGVVVVALRHPGLGWLSFALPPEEVHPLTEAIRNAAQPKH